MATLAEDISFGTGMPVEAVEVNLRKNTAASLSLLGADYSADRDAQHAQLAAMFSGVSTADPSTLVLVGRTRQPLVDWD